MLRIAIIPANVLISDPAAERLAYAVPVVIREDLTTSDKVLALPAANDSGAYQVAATAVLRSTVQEYKGRISVDATLTDVSTQRVSRTLHAEVSSSTAVVRLFDELARQLDPSSTPFPTRNAQALEAYTAAAEATNLQARMNLLNAAVAQDPSFGLGYVSLLESAAQTGEQNVASVLSRAKPNLSRFSALDRARFESVRARVSRARDSDQAKTASAVLRLAPNDIDNLAALGSAQFRSGDARDGERNLRRALDLIPGNVNVTRQLAEGYLSTRRYLQAETLFATIDNAPAVLPELAVCIYLEGDAQRANTVMAKFVASVPNADLKLILGAQWTALTSSLPSAIQTLESGKFGNPALHSLALSQTAIWRVLIHDTAGAARAVALAQALSQPGEVFSGVASVLVGAAASSGDWQSKVNSLPLPQNQTARETLLGYGTFLAGEYEQSANVWQSILKNQESDPVARTMLAASLDRAGHQQQAHKVGLQPFVPNLGDIYASISFREMNRLLRVGVI